MPRYLGINYLSEAFSERRQFLNQSLLTVPHHLEYVGLYSHCGKLSDPVYRGPWKRARPDDRCLLHEKGCVDSDLNCLLQDFKQPGIEKINWKESLNNEFTLYDIVPSSNPDSQESLPDFVLLEAMDDNLSPANMLDSTCNETFEKIDLSKDALPGSSHYIEEIIIRKPFEEFLQNLPTLHNMLRRLKQKPVKDPFIGNDGQPVDDAVFIVGDARYEESSETPEIQNKIKVSDREQFGKNCLLQTEEMLEETICASGLPSSETLNTVGHLKEFLPVTLDEKWETPDTLELGTSLKLGHAGDISNDLEMGKFSPSEDKEQKTFLDINGGKEYDRMDASEQLLIESPLEMTLTDKLEPFCDVSSMNGLLGKLKPLRLETTDKCDLTILSPRSRDALSETHWKKERYFNDILALRLTEPITSKDDSCGESVIKEAIQILSATKHQNLTEEELALPWDPFIHNRSSVPSIEKMRPAERMNVENKINSRIAPAEAFDKYQAAFFCDWQDSFLEPSSENRGFGCLKAAILARQRTASAPSKMTCLSKVILPTSVKTAGLNIAITKPTRSLVLPSSSDPLSDFFMIRSADIQHPVGHRQSTRESIVEVEPSPPEKQSKKYKSKILPVKLVGEYRKASCLMLEYGAHFLKPLQDHGILSNYQTLDSIPPDMTRFLLKQLAKQEESPAEIGVDTRRQLSALHVLSCAFDTLVHCSLESSISCLSAMQEKHQQDIGSCLVDLRQKLFQLQCKFQAGHVFHPKMSEMCKYIEDWLKRKKTKDKDLEPKVLVIMQRDLGTLQNGVRQVLATVPNFTPVVLSENDVGSFAILEKLDKYSCVVVQGRSIEEDFPWSQFSLVVGYEHQQSTSWNHTCLGQNIRYIGLTMDMDPDRQENSLPTASTTANPDSLHIYIGSHKLTSNTALLQLLETRFNTIIVERDYARLNPSLNSLHFADITLDEKTGVVLSTMEDMEEDWHLELLLTKLVSLHLKYLQCWLLLAPTGAEKLTQNTQQKKCFSNVAKLQASLANFCSSVEDFQVKIFTCKDTTELAHVINRIGEHLQEGPSSQTWVTKSILEENLSTDEIILMTFPCVNTISARMMLKTANLKKLFTMQIAQLKSTFPSLPNKVLKTFHHLVNSNSGLNLRASSSDSLNTDTSDCPNVDTPTPSDALQYSHRQHDPEDVEVARLLQPTVSITRGDPLTVTQMRGKYLDEVSGNVRDSTSGHSSIHLPDPVSNYSSVCDPNPHHQLLCGGVSINMAADTIDANNFDGGPQSIYEPNGRIRGRDSSRGKSNALPHQLDELQTHLRDARPQHGPARHSHSDPQLPSTVDLTQTDSPVEQDSLEYDSQLERPNEFTLAELEGQIAAENHRDALGRATNHTLSEADISELQYRSYCHSLASSHNRDTSEDFHTRWSEVPSLVDSPSRLPYDNQDYRSTDSTSSQYHMRGQRQSQSIMRLDGTSSHGISSSGYVSNRPMGTTSNVQDGFQRPLTDEHKYLKEFIASQNCRGSVRRDGDGGDSSGHLSQWQISSQPRQIWSSSVSEHPNFTHNTCANRNRPLPDHHRIADLLNEHQAYIQDHDHIHNKAVQQLDHQPPGFSAQRQQSAPLTCKSLSGPIDSRSLLTPSHFPRSRYNHPTWDAYPRPAIHRVSIGLAQPLPRKPPQADTEDSPPMDLDSEDSPDQLRTQDKYSHGTNTTMHSGHQNTYTGQMRKSRPQPGMSASGQGGLSGRISYSSSSEEPAMLSLVPTKRKRLGLEKVPGAKGGQTRLTLS